MKFLLDMGLAQSTARFLRQQGHDALHLRDQGLQRLAEVLSRFAAQLLEGAMISVTDQSIRVRQLPVQREQE